MRTIGYWSCIVFGMLFGSTVHAEVILSGVSSAENSLLTSTNRIFVTGDQKVYELTKSADNQWNKQAILAYKTNGQSITCDFLGITEMQGKVYAVCADRVLNPFSTKRLFSLDLSSASPTLNEVGQIENTTLINGLTNDGNGNLYIADSSILGPGKILKLRIGTGGVSQRTVLQYILAKPNGLKLDAGRLYVSLNAVTLLGHTQIARYDVSGERLVNGRTLYSSLSFFDDFSLVKNGLVITDFLTGQVKHIDENTGRVLHQSSFISPSSVLVGQQPILPRGTLLVTEKLLGTVYRYDNTWGLEPR
ncbi:hypothetical protein [Acinetobacter junii]|uniref:hypothetical protein n=1 Tax=Acinetobacter junii TaxID=40215 RepID=UPI0032127683